MIGRAEYFDLVKTRPEMFENPSGAAFEILLDDDDIEQAESRMARLLTERGAPADWASVGVAFRDQYVTILRDAVRFADGSVGTYVRMVEPNDAGVGVVILPVCDDQVLLIRHFRHATRTWHLEIPRGFGSSEQPEESARHELSEEIGASDFDLVKLGEMYPDSGAGDGRVALFYARVRTYGAPERLEGITAVVPTPIARFEEMLRANELKDGYLLAAYAQAKARSLI